MRRLKQLIGDLIGRVGLALFTKKVPIIKMLLEEPEKLMMEIYILGDGSISMNLKERKSEDTDAGDNKK